MCIRDSLTHRYTESVKRLSITHQNRSLNDLYQKLLQRSKLLRTRSRISLSNRGKNRVHRCPLVYRDHRLTHRYTVSVKRLSITHRNRSLNDLYRKLLQSSKLLRTRSRISLPNRGKNRGHRGPLVYRDHRLTQRYTVLLEHLSITHRNDHLSLVLMNRQHKKVIQNR